MSNNYLTLNESIVLESPTNLITSVWGGKIGVLKLTNKRLLFFKKSITLDVLIGIFSNILGGKIILDIPLSSISGISRRKIQFNSNILCIYTLDGSEYIFNLDFEKWLKTTDDMLKKYHNSKLTPEADNKWIVSKDI